MNKIILLLLFSIGFAACKKTNCGKDFDEHVGTYLLRDSVVDSKGSAMIRFDTVTTKMSGDFVNEFFIYNFDTSGIFLTAQGCPNSFTINTLSFGIGTYSGTGNFESDILKLKIHFVAPSYSSTDSNDHYCVGYRL